MIRAPRADAFAPAEGTAASEWVVTNLRNFDYTVGSVVPACYESYARIFHPAGRRVAGPAGYRQDEVALSRSGQPEALVRWAEVAAANGRQMHLAAEWGSITGSWRYQYSGSQGGIWDSPPETGSLPAPVAARLASVLASFSRTPSHCWFAVWEGRGPLQPQLHAAPRFNLPQRAMLLLRGSVDAAAVSPFPSPWGDSVNLWWPDDRAWCVGTDIDLMTTYVGGTDFCIQALLEDDLLEVSRVPVGQRVTWDADTINPLPPPP